MGKIFNYYSNDIDRTWYQSSNVKFSECIDKENELKTLRVVFNNGSQYEYTGVDVNQYLLFREDTSQGKALNKYIKGNNYEYKRLDNADVAALDEELSFRTNNGIFIINTDDSFVIKDNKDNEVYRLDKQLDDDTFNLVCDILKSLNLNIKEVKG